jgi:uncharacterized protein
MNIFNNFFTIAGLSAFEIVSSIDNAVINAEVLNKMSPWARRWFLTWGLFIAVFAMRGLLPFVIVFAINPSLGLWGTLQGVISSDPAVAVSIEKSAPMLLLGGGVFLLFLFLHWLFLEEKNIGLYGEKFFLKQGVWFYTIVSLLLCFIVYKCLQTDPFLALSAVIGSTAFFITHGFKQQAEQAEKAMLESGAKMSNWSKILYLEAIDAIFSIDGVVGAFAFTLNVPLILIGNGIGALVLRQLTVSNLDTIKKLRYLKNGAMYSILVLGVVMVLDSFHVHIPHWFVPVSTIGIIGWFYYKSKKAINEAIAKL